MACTYAGIDVSYSDGRPQIPIRVKTLPAEKEYAWLTANYEDEWPLRVLACQVAGSGELSPFSDQVVNVASPEDGTDYRSLTESEGGGSSALIGSPLKIVAQTPRDGGPFCSFAVTTTAWRKGIVCGLYQYDDPVFDCADILRGSKLFSGWRSDGEQVMVLPVAFLVAHVKHKAQAIASLNRRVAGLEEVLTQPRDLDDDLLDFGIMTRRLHDCSLEHIRLERRAHFEQGLVKNIEAMIDHETKGKRSTGSMLLLTGPLDLARNMMGSQAYDLEALPKRIESQRTLVFNLVIQRDSRLNLQIGRTNMEIAETSRRIAEASMRDSASMQTIAILTMVFLPGTAVASFFSMTMFNWEAGPGQALASAYVWVFFVAAIPLTAMVLIVWYVSIRRRRSKRSVRIQSSLFDMESRVQSNKISYVAPKTE